MEWDNFITGLIIGITCASVISSLIWYTALEDCIDCNKEFYAEICPVFNQVINKYNLSIEELPCDVIEEEGVCEFQWGFDKEKD